MTKQEARSILFRVLTKGNPAYPAAMRPDSLLSALSDRPIINEKPIRKTTLKVVKR